MRITFVVSHLKTNGGNRAILTYADLLAKRKHDVVVVAVTHGYIRRMLKNIFRIKVSWFPGLSARVIWVPSLEEANIPDGDAVIATAWQTAEPVASYGPRSGKKFYLVQHYESLYHGPADLVDKTYKLPLRKIVISTWLKDIMSDKFHEESKLIVTPVDLAQFHRVSVSRNNETVRILMLDHTAEWKGVRNGLAAFEAVNKKCSNTELVLLGVRKSGLVDGYEHHFSPKQNELASIYSSCDIYLCPSEYEGLGMPAMEAMACGCAVVTFDTGGSRDYAMDGKTAFVAKHGDVEDLIGKLYNAVSDAKLRGKIADQGNEFITSEFSWSVAVKQMERLFVDELDAKSICNNTNS